MYAVFDTDLVLIHSSLLSLGGVSAPQMIFTTRSSIAACLLTGKPENSRTWPHPEWARAAKGECPYGRSGLRPSLVLGDTPRNAPLQKPVSPPPHCFPTTIPRISRAPFILARTRAQGAVQNWDTNSYPPASNGAIAPTQWTVGAGLVPARCLSQSRRTISATAGMNSPPYYSHPKWGLHPERSAL